MRTIQGHTLQSLRAVQAFLLANAMTMPAVFATGTRKHLDATLAQIDEHIAVQAGNTIGSRGATQRLYLLRAMLLQDQMAPIARIAAASLLISPDIEPLRMPKGRPTAERLRAAALGMSQAAEPFASVFIDAGLPSDFIEALVAAADAMTGSISLRKQSRVAVSGATVGLASKLTEARKLVHVLDAFVRTALRDNQSLLAAWEQAKRVGKPNGSHGGAGGAASHAVMPTMTTSGRVGVSSVGEDGRLSVA